MEPRVLRDCREFPEQRGYREQQARLALRGRQVHPVLMVHPVRLALQVPQVLPAQLVWMDNKDLQELQE